MKSFRSDGSMRRPMEHRSFAPPAPEAEYALRIRREMAENASLVNEILVLLSTNPIDPALTRRIIAFCDVHKKTAIEASELLDQVTDSDSD